MRSILDTIRAQVAKRFDDPAQVAIKVNLYRDYEVVALARALQSLGYAGNSSVECVMVADSYFMTHLGRASTALPTADERQWGFDEMRRLVAEVRTALDREFALAYRPLLVVDLPDGAAADAASSSLSAARMTEAGAEVLKLEIVSDQSYAIVEAMAKHGYAVMGHIGYTPQHGFNRRYGDTLQEAVQLFEAARRLRGAGAVSLVLERASAPVYQAIASRAEGQMQVYGIFSGQATYGGQCINVWDAVIRPASPAQFFPPTAALTRAAYPDYYTVETIERHLVELIALTLSRQFPISPITRLRGYETEALRMMDPWSETASGPLSPEPAPSSNIFEESESAVRVYCRKFPVVFETASGSWLVDDTGRVYLDFMSGAGALNYGHNHPAIKQRVLGYLAADGVVHGLDLHTSAKADFLRAFTTIVLKRKGLDYKVQFTGPTGTNAVEAAFKLARKLTGRATIAAFTNGFHGMSLGSLAATGSGPKRAGAGVPLQYVQRLPYDGYLGKDVDTIAYLERLLEDPGSGFDLPAAIIVETVQGEGGINSASPRWMQRLAEVARTRGILLIVDEIQTGCGRTGTFFSFEEAGIVPDIVCVSKSISGIGLPMALMLMRRELDVQTPGEHSGTFRGNNLAFVAATAALELWNETAFLERLADNIATLTAGLEAIALRHKATGARVVGRGLLRGLCFNDSARAEPISRAAFERGLLVETSGASSQTLKVMPALTISPNDLRHGLQLLEASIESAAAPAPARRGMALVGGER